METFTLVIWLWGADWTSHKMRRPGLTDIECKLQAAEVRKPRRAECVREPAVPPKAPEYRPDDRIIRELPPCASPCGQRLPGRRVV